MNSIYLYLHKTIGLIRLRIDLKSVLGAALVFIGAVGFSAKAIFVKLAYQFPIDATSLLALRMLFAIPFFMLVALLNKNSLKNDLTLKDYAAIALAGIIGNYMAGLLAFMGLQFVTASMERLILFIYPTIIVILSALIFKKKITRIQVIALFLTYTGILIVFAGNIELTTHPDFLWGVFLILGSALTYSTYLISSEKLIPKAGSTRFTALAMLASTIAIMVHFSLSNQTHLMGFDQEVYLLSLGMAIFSTVIPAFLISMGIKIIGASNTGIVASVGPVSTIFLAFIFLNEVIEPSQLLGTFVVLAGVMLITLKGIRKKTSAKIIETDIQ